MVISLNLIAEHESFCQFCCKCSEAQLLFCTILHITRFIWILSCFLLNLLSHKINQVHKTEICIISDNEVLNILLKSLEKKFVTYYRNTLHMGTIFLNRHLIIIF